MAMQGCSVDRDPASNWMKVQEHKPSPLFADCETHQIKITQSTGRLVPALPYLARFRVGRVNRASFFAWGQDRILRMAERKTPAGITVDPESRTVCPRLLETVQFPAVQTATPICRPASKPPKPTAMLVSCLPGGSASTAKAPAHCFWLGEEMRDASNAAPFGREPWRARETRSSRLAAKRCFVGWRVDSHAFDGAVVVAVVAVGVMQVAVDQVIGVIAVGNALVPTFRTMLVALIVSATEEAPV
jgi:hypothetical protein